MTGSAFGRPQHDDKVRVEVQHLVELGMATVARPREGSGALKAAVGHAWASLDGAQRQALVAQLALIAGTVPPAGMKQYREG